MIDNLENGQTVRVFYYMGFVELMRKRWGKLNNEVHLLHDNAPAHRAKLRRSDSRKDWF